jgi:hypothetical protein
MTRPSALSSGPPSPPGAGGRIGLNHVRDGQPARGRELLLQRRHDPVGEGPVVAEWVTEREHRIANSDGGRIAGCERDDRGNASHIDPEHGNVVVWILGHHGRVPRHVTGECDRRAGRTGHDAVAGEDVAVGVGEKA